MYMAKGQGQTAPRGQNFDVNRKALLLYPFVASFKEISLKSDFIHFFHDLIHVYSPRAGLVSNHRRQKFLKNPLFYLFPIHVQKQKRPNLNLL